MAHIAELLVNPTINKYISREPSPSTPHERTLEEGPLEDREKERYIWRMHQPSEARRYQLFPVQDKLSIAPSLGRKSPEGTKSAEAELVAVGTMAPGSSPPVSMRNRVKDQVLLRKRKPSISDLGLMATVQEVAMDSPTIPGRPPLHERSISAPGQRSWRQNVFGETILAGVEGPSIDGASQPNSAEIQGQRRNSTSPKGFSSAKNLTLVIPPNMSASPETTTFPQRVLNRLSEQSDTGPEVPPKSARMFESSPLSGSKLGTPFTPLTDSTSTTTFSPLKISTTFSPITPSSIVNSALEGRSSPQSAGVLQNRGGSPIGHIRGQSESCASRSNSTFGHRRTESEASIMDRGRPKKRADGTIIKSAETKASEQKAFESLPQGIKATDASSLYSNAEMDMLRKQAIGQAAKFEVLNSKDVERLSRELRALDERCEYLRKTHGSLRSGRRNLHQRICSYLRSPRVARFSHESLLKQEEALSELDSSIDDWVSKLEQAENRRTRVRQKLLEHVAAALTLSPSLIGGKSRSAAEEEALARRAAAQLDNTPPRSPTKSHQTPPRSPSRAPPSPSPTPPVRLPPSPTTGSPVRLARPVPPAQLSCAQSPPRTRPRTADRESLPGRPSAESIRIYADSEVYALLADVEEEINRMGQNAEEELVILGSGKFEGLGRIPSPWRSDNRRGRNVTPTGRERQGQGQRERVAGLTG